MNKIKEIIKILKLENKTISFAESMTGGLLVSELVKYSGASKVLKESYITYSNEAKKKILGVREETILENSIVSEAVATEMCEGLKKITNSDICISITGNAGPILQEMTENLESYICIIFGQMHEIFKLSYKKVNRKKILKKTVLALYDILYDLLKNK